MPGARYTYKHFRTLLGRARARASVGACAPCTVQTGLQEKVTFLQMGKGLSGDALFGAVVRLPAVLQLALALLAVLVLYHQVRCLFAGGHGRAEAAGGACAMLAVSSALRCTMTHVRALLSFTGGLANSALATCAHPHACTLQCRSLWLHSRHSGKGRETDSWA